MTNGKNELQLLSAPSEVDFMRLFARHTLEHHSYTRLTVLNWSFLDDFLQDASVSFWGSRAKLRGETVCKVPFIIL